jgi:hypothetical protein
LKKAIKEDSRVWKDLPCSWLSVINIVKITILLKMVYRSSAIPLEIPMTFLTEIGGKNPKIHMEIQKTLKSQRNPEQKE